MKDKKTISLIIAIFSVVIIVIAGIIVVQEGKMSGESDKAQTSAVQQEDGEGQTGSDSKSGSDKATEETAEFSLGEIQGNAYYNSFAGLMFNLPSDDWSFLSAEETAQLANAKVSKSKAIYSNFYGTFYYDACISDKKTKTTVQLALFKSSEKKNLTAKQMANVVYERQKDIYDDFKHGDFYELQVAGSTYLCTDCVYTQDGTDKRCTLAVRKIGSDFVCITTDLILNNDENLSSDYLSIFREYMG